MVYRWHDRWNEGISYMANLIQEGKIKVKDPRKVVESVVEIIRQWNVHISSGTKLQGKEEERPQADHFANRAKQSLD